MPLLHCIRRTPISLEKKLEQLKPPESLCLEESLTETWKRQLQYSLKLLKANGNEEQLERMKSSTYMCHPYWPRSHGYGLKIKTDPLQAPPCSTPLLQSGFIFNGTQKRHEKAHKAASPQDKSVAVAVTAAPKSWWLSCCLLPE